MSCKKVQSPASKENSLNAGSNAVWFVSTGRSLRGDDPDSRQTPSRFEGLRRPGMTLSTCDRVSTDLVARASGVL